MITISKGREPKAWTFKKATPGFTEYERISELGDALLAEQGYICAYCMRRIPVKDPDVAPVSKIEHIKSREDRNDLQLDYHNMVICCPGNMDSEPHCDNLKGRKSVTFNFFDDALQNSISYSTKNGNIKSDNATWDIEINSLLNLNHKRLKLNRKNTLLGVIEVLKSKGWSTSSISEQMKNWRSFDNKGNRKPYCGIVTWYLGKKQQQIEKRF